MIAFVSIVTFLGLFSMVPLRKIMIVDFKLTYPSGTATAHLINSFQQRVPTSKVRIRIEKEIATVQTSSKAACMAFKVFIAIAMILGDVISVVVVPIIFHQLKWYYIVVIYVIAPALPFCNAYGCGLTHWSLASAYGKLAIFTIGAWAGASHGGVIAVKINERFGLKGRRTGNINGLA
ncbi:hypothetical protein VNO80_30521 [Phaseolus coccineus]|uniref:Uncharacterized protein n=1 Tax=Phaseolus coccineus TaxID=3886 RepID=A0AAN9LGG3_PHACN